MVTGDKQGLVRLNEDILWGVHIIVVKDLDPGKGKVKKTGVQGVINAQNIRRVACSCVAVMGGKENSDQ